jgi:sulfite reductase alpha subunit-like flavoprotein
MASLYILYGSATGNAEHIAKDLASKPIPSGFDNIICEPLDKFKKFQDTWVQPPTVNKRHGIVMVSSTTGNGDAPENASRFVRFIKRKGTPTDLFQYCAFSVLGLGDTNYDQFCETGKMLDRKMRELGGHRARPLECADEATGLEDVVEPWSNQVLADIIKACLGDDTESKVEELPSGEECVAAEPIGIASQASQQPAPETPSLAETNDTTEQDATSSPLSISSSPLFILYASATGNAEHIAKDLASTYETIQTNPDADTYFPSVICCEADQFKKKCTKIWEDAPPAGTKHGILIVASTTGNADVPENASRFARFIKHKTTPETYFSNCAFAVLGLGDTNYDVFCATGKAFDSRLHALGGTRAKPLACADEATGLEDVVEPWKSNIFWEITKACRGGEREPLSTIPLVPTKQVLAPANEPKPLEVAPPCTTESPGVSTLRNILGLSPSTCIPAVEHSTLPSLATSLSSCQLIAVDEETRRRSRGNSVSLADMERMTISSNSSSVIFTQVKPFETTIVGARYLTKTKTVAAKTAWDILQAGALTDDKVIQAMDIYAKEFPLDGEDYDISLRNGKRVIELRLSLPDDFTLEYQPGDSLGITVANQPRAVSFVLKMLKDKHGIEPTQKISIDFSHPITVEQAIRRNIDLCSPLKSKRIIHSLSQFATDPADVSALRLLASKTAKGEEAFQRYIDEQRITIVDLLREFTSSQSITLEGLIGLLPGIPPRYYSVSSSPLERKHGALSLTVAFSVVDYVTPSLIVEGQEMGCRRIAGIATRYLEVLCSPFLCGVKDAPCLQTLPIFPKPSADFHLPATLSTPLILIGPGTGIAPFMGFLAHRAAQIGAAREAAKEVVEGTWRGGYELEEDDVPISDRDTRGLNVGMDYQKIGKIDVFFGCRHMDHDWLFAEEMQAWDKEGLISNLHVAFSRGDCKTYVQDVMIHDEVCRANLVHQVLEDNASIYVCGDGNKMAKDVQAAIVEVLSSKLGSVEGQQYLDDMKKSDRFVMDIWS